jgi:hypothetical protein
MSSRLRALEFVRVERGWDIILSLALSLSLDKGDAL